MPPPIPTPDCGWLIVGADPTARHDLDKPKTPMHTPNTHLQLRRRQQGERLGHLVGHVAGAHILGEED